MPLHVAQIAVLLRPLQLVADLAEMQAPVETRTWRFRSFEALLLQHGRIFTAPATEHAADFRGRNGRCYHNAAELSDASGHAYVEGVAGASPFPVGVQHAWCVDRNSQVLEPTWPTDQPRIYFGMPVTAAFRRTVSHPALLHHHEAGRALLRHGLPAGAQVDVGEPVSTMLQ
ncbi:hypothetical protein Daura_22980 [Dactylosporangium aurantiacum]|uniref:Uncharacterized protein n=1 Tax=Dactylosporangium aurantiacum TaxID=35754 RepID=A0A9Q9IS37_9ACTN|nr:hypothetical protein [Dactylosporangium aurantiacum]MDG6107624.1 hypothetical protein [Dactylosporangium aurantiacum]UWZ58777.1 hypothetical protein Daura_22980 [Dactylosporangium aurantiacum]